MGIYGTRDGIFKARALQIEQKRYKQDNYHRVLGSADVLKQDIDCTATAAATIGTQMDCPRSIIASNAMGGAAERAIKLVVKGYTGQGEYAEEQITLTTGASGKSYGNVAFGYISSIVPAVATKGYGTYGTVSIYAGTKFGLTEYCETEADVLEIAAYAEGTSGYVKTSTTALVTSTTFSPTYQTVNLNTIVHSGSTLAIKYLSKFQERKK